MLPNHIVESAVMRHHPLLFDLRGKKLLFVGCGKVAERKIKSLLHTEAEITVISPRMSLSFTHENLRLINKEFEEHDITQDFFLVFVCTDDREINRIATEKAKSLKIPVNVADDPESCDFHMPSVIITDEYTVSVSTGGKSPSMAKALRIKLEEFLKGKI